MAELRLKNFAKIKESSLDIKDITVIAGKPGTGKSYIMKVLYSIYEAIHMKKEDYRKNLAKVREITDNAKKSHSKIKRDLLLTNKNEKKDLDSFLKILNEIDEKLKEASILTKKTKTLSGLEDNIENLLKSIFSNLNEINKDFYVKYNNLLLNYSKDKLSVKFKDNLSSSLSENIIFIETPLILEFKKFMNREKGKTPYHIESLLNILDTDYSFADEEQEKFIKGFSNKSKEIIKGSIENTSDSFIFSKDGDKNYDIVNASSGIKSIGLLQYLVTNKALKKGSVLFWEEPEVHLHPTWQLKMIELFIELMNAGVKIVFSTHSPYMCDYLNALSKNKEFRNRISFNLLNEENNIVENTILNDDNWDKLQDELLKPLEEIMWEYL